MYNIVQLQTYICFGRGKACHGMAQIKKHPTPGCLWVPESTITGDNQSSTLHRHIFFLQSVEDALHEVGQVPQAKLNSLRQHNTANMRRQKTIHAASDCKIRHKRPTWYQQITNIKQHHVHISTWTQADRNSDKWRALHKHLGLLSESRSSWLLTLNGFCGAGLHCKICGYFHHGYSESRSHTESETSFEVPRGSCIKGQYEAVVKLIQGSQQSQKLQVKGFSSVTNMQCAASCSVQYFYSTQCEQARAMTEQKKLNVKTVEKQQRTVVGFHALRQASTWLWDAQE